MKTGCAFVKGRAGSVKGNKSSPIPAEEAGLNRMDRVVIRLDKSIRAVCADIVKGTPTSETPTPPSLTRTEIIYEIAPYRLQNLGGTYTLLDDRADANACGYIAKSRFEEIMVVGSKNYGTVLPTTENETGRVFFLLDQ